MRGYEIIGTISVETDVEITYDQLGDLLADVDLGEMYSEAPEVLFDTVYHMVNADAPGTHDFLSMIADTDAYSRYMDGDPNMEIIALASRFNDATAYGEAVAHSREWSEEQIGSFVAGLTTNETFAKSLSVHGGDTHAKMASILRTVADALEQ